MKEDETHIRMLSSSVISKKKKNSISCVHYTIVDIHLSIVNLFFIFPPHTLFVNTLLGERGQKTRLTALALSIHVNPKAESIVIFKRMKAL